MHIHRWSKKCNKSSRPPHKQPYIFFLTFLSFQRAYVICRWFLKKFQDMAQIICECDIQSSVSLFPVKANVFFTFFRRQEIYNSGHTILALFNNLEKVRIATSKAILDIQRKKLPTRVASQVAKLIKTQDLRKLGNIRKRSNSGGAEAQYLVFLPKIKL